MGRSGPGILDLLSSIGLRAPYTKVACDWHASENAPVKEFYMERIPNLCELHFTKSNDEILHGSATRTAAVALFEEYGPRIWSRAKHRPWLFNPGEITKHEHYKRNLYFDIPEDYTLWVSPTYLPVMIGADSRSLKGKVCELVIERIFRHHKDNISKTRASSVDGSWRSTPAPTTRSARNSLLGSVTGAVCFSTAFGLAAHQDASALQEQGVWLGCWNNCEEAVNGPSFDDVTKEYYFQTDAGKRKGYDEPHVFDEAPEVAEDYLLCAGCQNGALLKVQCLGFEWEDEDNDTVMTKNVWVYPCNVGDRKVFALVKKMSGPSTGAIVWGFWRVDGGYTQNLLLVSRPKAMVSRRVTHLSPGQSPPKRSSDGLTNAHRAKQAKRDHGAQEMDVVRTNTPQMVCESGSSTSSGPLIVPREWAPIESMDLVRERNGPHAMSSKAYGKLPLRDSVSRADQSTQLRPSPVDTTAGGINEEDLYGSTPRRERQLTKQGFFRQVTQMVNSDASAPASHRSQDRATDPTQEEQLCQQSLHQSQQRVSATMRQESTPPANSQMAEAPHYRFRYFVTADWTQNQNIVKLDDAMDVQAVYSRVRRTLNRKLEGRDIASLTFLIQNEEPIDVEVDDSDAWETVVEMLKDATLFAVKGTVSRSN